MLESCYKLNIERIYTLFLEIRIIIQDVTQREKKEKAED